MRYFAPKKSVDLNNEAKYQLLISGSWEILSGTFQYDGKEFFNIDKEERFSIVDVSHIHVIE